MERLSREPARDAYILLKIAFIVLPIVTGIDKFFELLVNWDQYLSFMFGRYGERLMLVAGAFEILAGVGIYLKPKIFAYIIGVWLLFIVLNLLILGNFYDVAFIDLALCFSAFALGRLAKVYG